MLTVLVVDRVAEVVVGEFQWLNRKKSNRIPMIFTAPSNLPPGELHLLKFTHHIVTVLATA